MAKFETEYEILDVMDGSIMVEADTDIEAEIKAEKELNELYPDAEDIFIVTTKEVVE